MNQLVHEDDVLHVDRLGDMQFLRVQVALSLQALRPVLFVLQQGGESQTVDLVRVGLLSFEQLALLHRRHVGRAHVEHVHGHLLQRSIPLVIRLAVLRAVVHRAVDALV